MTQHEFVAVYVVVPLMIAIGWLLWRARALLRSLVLYALAVAAVLAFIRLGHLAWRAWEHATRPAETDMPALCLDAEAEMWARPKSSCWM